MYECDRFLVLRFYYETTRFKWINHSQSIMMALGLIGVQMG